MTTWPPIPQQRSQATLVDEEVDMFDSVALAFSIAVAAPHEAAQDVNSAQSFAPAVVSSSNTPDAARMLAEVNLARQASGLGALRLDQNLSSVAWEHAEDMLQRHYFGHVSPNGITPQDRLRAHGEQTPITGENIAWCADEHEAEIALFQSEGHRSNELEPRFQRIGIAVVDTGDQGELFVQVYAN